MSVSLNLLSPIKKQIVDSTAKAIESSVSELIYDVKTNIVLTFCDNEYIKMLNMKYRKKDEPTDVLSFPLLTSDAAGSVNYSQIDFEPDTDELMLGDIIISLERATRQAREYGHSLERELCYLAVHSVLHIFGYDHIEDNDRLLMRQKEKEILDSLGINR